MLVNGTWHYLDMANVDFEWGFMGMPKFFDYQYTWGSNHFSSFRSKPNSKQDMIKPAMEALKWMSETPIFGE